MGFTEFGEDYIDKLQEGLGLLNLAKLQEAAWMIQRCEGTVWLIGNGGSAALASHMATDLQLAGVRAISLTDVSAVTTYANDFGFNTCFEKQLVCLARPGDILIAISGSGNSTNVINPCEWARENGVFVIGMSGFGGGILKWGLGSSRPVCHLHLDAPVEHMGQAQDIEQIMLHIIAYYLMQKHV